ncbi:MFS transporter [Roseomonas alkaliterrae]|uniref:2-oxoglutarate dehydrogenase E1 component n=1 Tax=Neoroseomonas alkaliterrae TaxID=1452450 RepID=A0A840XPG0_9PROT|nr:alpha-ketoacid dehydrogenase subunit alpha/beta [Neoroseomonas alkaliterrae]MBB5688700.1 2-oxoisovalerate dehydrogenase E1 component [Neoroseomonas alkaliterrae]MBR0675225.1 MFS transporter [Neoroseomonas alkaliterrae]
MPDTTPILPSAPCLRLRATEADWDALSPAEARAMWWSMQAIRSFEEAVLRLASETLVHGPAHSSIGQEGGATGAIFALKPGDQINGSHRGHHQFLAKALRHVGATDAVTPEARGVMRQALAEIMGLSPGWSGGRGGSMHLRWAEAGCLGTNAIVGGGVPLAAGAAAAMKFAGTDNVAVTFLGDGATNIGAALETMNLAAAWSLPMVFFIENNGYAVSTTVAESTRETRLAARGMGFGIPSWQVDGMDPLAVKLAMEQAVALCRAGKGPALIEAECYRFFHQNGPLPGSAFGYRTKEEEAAWRARDPISALGRRLPQAETTRMRAEIEAAMAEIVEEFTEPAGNARRIRPALWPDPATKDEHIRGDLSELRGMRTEFRGRIVSRKFIDCVSEVMHRRMATDPRIIVMGEDIHRLRGGTNGATRGLAEAFPGRILGTPIAEAAFMGLAGGMAMDGRFRPVVEFMYPDFLWVAADQVFNQAAKARHMFGGTAKAPLVLRTKVAIGTGYGSQHSMDPAGIFATAPGWRIVAPSTPYDYVGLMNAALACDDPVLVLEHVALYQSEGEAPEGDWDYVIPIGSAKTVRRGSAVTVATYLNMVSQCVAAADATGADAEVIDLRTLDRASLDWATVEASVKRTGALIVVEEGAQGPSWGGWFADAAQRWLFDWLDAPVARVTGGEASPTISKVLEHAARATQADVEAALLAMERDRGRR